MSYQIVRILHLFGLVTKEHLWKRAYADHKYLLSIAHEIVPDNPRRLVYNFYPLWRVRFWVSDVAMPWFPSPTFALEPDYGDFEPITHGITRFQTPLERMEGL